MRTEHHSKGTDKAYRVALLCCVAAIVLFAAFAADQPAALAQRSGGFGLEDVAGQVKNAPTTFRQGMDVSGIVVGVIQAALGLVGVIFFLLMLYSGFQWMTARGNEDQVKKAKETIVSSVIGILIVMAAYGITFLVFEAFS